MSDIQLPFTYIGLAIGGNVARIDMREPIIARLNKKTCFLEG